MPSITHDLLITLWCPSSSYYSSSLGCSVRVHNKRNSSKKETFGFYIYFRFFFFCMLICVWIIFCVVCSSEVYYYFFALIATTWRSFKLHTNTATVVSFTCPYTWSTRVEKKLPNRDRENCFLFFSINLELAASQNNHNYVNSHITMQATTNNEPVHSSSSKDYVNQAVINESQQKHKSSAHHKHRKSHKSSSNNDRNDKRYHSGKQTPPPTYHPLSVHSIFNFTTIRPVSHHLLKFQLIIVCILYLDFLKLTMT